jgi:hypothetical protein
MSVMALLLGFVAAPYTHVHQSARGLSNDHGHHSRPATLLHTHVTAHSEDPDAHHPPAEGDQDAEQTMWSVGGFVFQPASTAQAPLPALLVYTGTSIVSTGSRLRVTVTQPGAHAPPVTAASNLRAPPFVPAAVS